MGGLIAPPAKLWALEIFFWDDQRGGAIPIGAGESISLDGNFPADRYRISPGYVYLT